MSGVSRHFHIPNADASSETKIRKDFASFSTPAVIGKGNRTPAVFDVDVETSMEPGKSSRWQVRLERDHPRLNPQQKNHRCSR